MINIRKIEPIPAIIVLIFLSFSLFGLNDMMLYRPDSARYLIWAESLSSGQGFVDSTLPYPVSYVIHAPLYSMLLSPVAFFFPLNIEAAKFLNILLTAVLMIAFWRLVEEKSTKTVANAAMAVLVLNPLTILYASQPLSDISFALVCVLLFLTVERITAWKEYQRLLAVAMILLLASAVLLREIGITLFAAVILFYLLRKEYKRAMLIAIVPLILYGLWYVRNEMIIAQLENPPLRNSVLFLSHFFSSNQDSIVSEFIARIENNGWVYLSSIARLVFSPEYGETSRSVVRMSESPLSLAAAIVRYVNPLLIVISFGLAGYGIVKTYTRFILHNLLVLFLLFYTTIILLYPIIDTRFLYPFLILLIYFGALGAHEAIDGWRKNQQKSPTGFVLAMTLLIVLLLPNMVWSYAFIRNQIGYTRSPLEFYEENRDKKDSPVCFAKPVSLAGRWLSENTPEDVTLCSIYKEVALFSKGRKVIDLSPMLPTEELERSIRDFEIEYFVVAVNRNGLREFETQMAQSHRYRFTSLHRMADLEIIRVSMLEKRADTVLDTTFDLLNKIPSGTQTLESEIHSRRLFWESLRWLEKNQSYLAGKILEEIEGGNGKSALIAFQKGVALEFAGEYDNAVILFEEIKLIPQAGPYLEMAARHLQTIQWLREAEEPGIPLEKKNALSANIGIQYWRMGYLTQADSFLTKAISANQAQTLLYTFKVLLSLQLGDTLAAKRYADLLKKTDPGSTVNQTLDTLFHSFSVLQTENSTESSQRHYQTLADQYQKLGMLDMAIDELKRSQFHLQAALEPLRSLAGLYEVRKQYAPLLNVLHRMRTLNPDDHAVEMRIKELELGKY
ncbi:MAG: hypothetical protein V1799_19395 [bacterium]